MQRALTHDEKKAAEAAFAGRPFNDAWSASARLIYDGIVKALPQCQSEPVPLVQARVEEEVPAATAADLPEPEAVTPDTGEHDLPNEGPTTPSLRSREEAIRSGALIDVTPTARQLGLSFPVSITRPLWEVGIATTSSMSEEERAIRLRDVLLAFRLRLASLATISPLIDFPAMLTLPPSKTPQPVPLFALIQPDKANQANVTLLLPNEVSIAIAPLN